GLRADQYEPGRGGFAMGRFSPGHPGAIVTLNKHLAELEPKIREFQGAVNSIEKAFRGKLDTLLTTEQRTKLAAMEAKAAPETAGPGPLPPPQFEVEGPGVVPAPPLPQGAEGQRLVVGFPTPFPVGGWLMLSMIIYQPALGHLTSELQLDAS